MEKSKTKKKRCASKPPLSVTGPLAVPDEILPWERDLLVVVLEAVEGSEKGEHGADHEVTS